MAAISQARTNVGSAGLRDLPEQFVLIASCSFPLYSAAINQAAPGKIYLENLLSKRRSHKAQVAERAEAQRRERRDETDATEADAGSHRCCQQNKNKALILFFPPLFLLLSSM